MVAVDDARLQAILTEALNSVARTPFLTLPLDASIQDVGIDSIGLSNLVLDLETALDVEFEEAVLLTLSEAETVGVFYETLRAYLTGVAHAA